VRRRYRDSWRLSIQGQHRFDSESSTTGPEGRHTCSPPPRLRKALPPRLRPHLRHGAKAVAARAESSSGRFRAGGVVPHLGASSSISVVTAGRRRAARQAATGTE
jgi:hypothetical protein